MTGNIFKDWLTKIDSDMVKQKTKIVIFMDNVSSHKVNVSLSNVNKLYIPANSMSKIQPLDQGIIKILKSNYRRLIFKYAVHLLDQDQLVLIQLQST